MILRSISSQITNKSDLTFTFSFVFKIPCVLYTHINIFPKTSNYTQTNKASDYILNLTLPHKTSPKIFFFFMKKRKQNEKKKLCL